MTQYNFNKIFQNSCLCLFLWFASFATHFAHAEQEWVADEIFLQLSEMRKEVQQLQKRLAELENQQPKLAPIALTDSEAMTFLY
jgi:uncharacterized coiled-coil protein SlyX